MELPRPRSATLGRIIKPLPKPPLRAAETTRTVPPDVVLSAEDWVRHHKVVNKVSITLADDAPSGEGRLPNI